MKWATLVRRSTMTHIESYPAWVRGNSTMKSISISFHFHSGIFKGCSNPAGYMINLTMHEILLPLRLHMVSCSRSGRPGGALPCKMVNQTTLETSSTSTVSLSWCTVRGWGIRAGPCCMLWQDGCCPLGRGGYC
jgi:hypothetical protein